MDKTAFIEFMMECGVLQFGDFKTKSGRMSPYFINTGNYNTGPQLDLLGSYYARLLFHHFGDHVTNIFGPAYKGIPIATSTAGALSRDFSLDVSLSFNRKEVKDHGEGGWLLGFDYSSSSVPQNVVIVEDVTTAGTSVRENLPSISRFDHVRVTGLVVSVDRMEKGGSGKPALRELEDEFGIKAVSLINFKDLVAYLKTTDFENREDLVSRMESYWKEYGAGD